MVPAYSAVKNLCVITVGPPHVGIPNYRPKIHISTRKAQIPVWDSEKGQRGNEIFAKSWIMSRI